MALQVLGVRFACELERRKLLLRCWHSDYRAGEIAWATLGLRGIQLEIEFPSDWHEHARVWVLIGFGLGRVAFSFPYRGKLVPDEGQCSGPTYGFHFVEDALIVQWGKSTGRYGPGEPPQPRACLWYPWSWHHVRHDYLNPDGSLHHRAGQQDYTPPAETTEQHPYHYLMCDWTVQERVATVNGEEREWRWRWLTWLPWPRMIKRSINIEFSDEVGERTGSWKGGTIGCSWPWKRGETMEQALRRMERVTRAREFR